MKPNSLQQFFSTNIYHYSLKTKTWLVFLNNSLKSEDI